MKLSKEEESTLILTVTEAIQKANVHSFKYIGFPKSWVDHYSQDLSQDLSSKLSLHLDDGGLSSFLTKSLLKRFFYAGLEFPDEDESQPFGFTSVPLLSYPYFSDPLALSRNLVSEIAALPRQYDVCMPIFLSDTQKLPRSFDLVISERLRLIGCDDADGIMVTSLNHDDLDWVHRSYGARDVVDLPQSAGAYLYFKTSGCISDRNKPKPLADFYDDIKTFFGACFSFDLMHRVNFLGEKKEVPIFVNEYDGELRTLALVEMADPDITDAANCYSKERVDRDWTTEEGLKRIFAEVSCVFNSSERQRLKTACIWLMRSFLSDRGMDEILEATIAIEVLLGDREASDRIGLSKLMANRCAYALGESAEDRREIIEFFTKFYKLRSDIVHSGRVRISKADEKIVREGRILATRLLRHECGM